MDHQDLGSSFASLSEAGDEIWKQNVSNDVINEKFVGISKVFESEFNLNIFWVQRLKNKLVL